MLQEFGCGNGWLVARHRNQAGNKSGAGNNPAGSVWGGKRETPDKKLSWNIEWMMISSLLELAMILKQHSTNTKPGLGNEEGTAELGGFTHGHLKPHPAPARHRRIL